MRFRNRSDFVITPQMRIDHLASSREAVRKNFGSYAREFPWSYAKHCMGAVGLPLEAIRWINTNDYKPKAWAKRVGNNIRERWHDLLIKLYRIPDNAYELAGEDELRAYVATMKKKVSEHSTSWHRGKYWFSHPADHIINREIVHPKTNGVYLAGATSCRFDEDFFTFVALPYRFRQIPVETLMAVLFPDEPLSKYEFLPDSGTPELERHIENSYQSGYALEMAVQNRHNNTYDDYSIAVDGDTFTVTLTKDNAVVSIQAFSRADVVAFYEKRFR